MIRLAEMIFYAVLSFIRSSDIVVGAGDDKTRLRGQQNHIITGLGLF